MKGALIGGNILGDFDIGNRTRARRAERRLERLHGNERLREQLPGCRRVTPVVRSLAEEADAPADEV